MSAIPPLNTAWQAYQMGKEYREQAYGAPYPPLPRDEQPKRRSVWTLLESILRRW
jgi:hypothetical protein